MTAVARPALRPLPLGAALAGLAALAVSLLLGPGASPIPAALLGALAAGLLLAEVLRRSRELLRSGLGPQILLALLGSAVVSAAWSVVVAAHAEYLGLAFVLGLGGTALVMLGLLRVADELGDGQTPWQALTGGPTDATGAVARFRRVAPLLTGLLALLIGLRLLVEAFMSPVNGGLSDRAFLLTLVMLAVFVVGPGWALREVVKRKATSQLRGPQVARDEQVVAAHLHDSVLQTLSLIQRNASDPAKVSQLARQQERSLRSWLAGRDDTSATTLAGAARLAAQEVEDEHPGAVVEVVAVGDAPLDREADAMVRAAREAMRNAARHAGSPVRVFLEVEDDGARELFVRDTGAGFDLGAVADERRGVRDAIIGRMEHVGGTATIDSSPTGTEIALRLAAPTAGRPA